MLHFDILKLISYHFEPKCLVLNRETEKMYDDDWYCNKLQLLHPSLVLHPCPTYKDLYRKSVKQGTIKYSKVEGVEHEFTFTLKTSGVKAAYNDFMGCHYILNFNGELYKEDDNSVTLIDTEVIDISVGGYIKKHEYYAKEGSRIYLPDEILIKIEGGIILTNKGLRLCGMSFTPIIADDVLLCDGLFVFVQNRVQLVVELGTGVFIDIDVKYYPNIGFFDNDGNPVYVTIDDELLYRIYTNVGSFDNESSYKVDTIDFKKKIKKHTRCMNKQYIISDDDLYIIEGKSEITKHITGVKNVFTHEYTYIIMAE